MEGADAFPDDNRHITGYKTPANFVPQYGVSTTRDAGDDAVAASNAAGAAKRAEEAKKKAEEDEIQAAREKETVKGLAEKKARLLGDLDKAEAIVKKEEIAKEIKELDKQAAEAA